MGWAGQERLVLTGVCARCEPFTAHGSRAPWGLGEAMGSLWACTAATSALLFGSLSRGGGA